ncbi:hypothetical protein [Pantanalinema sp. GBBB05]
MPERVLCATNIVWLKTASTPHTAPLDSVTFRNYCAALRSHSQFLCNSL